MKVLVVDDHTVVREGVRQLLADTPGAEVYEAVRLKAKLALGTTNDLVRASVEIKRKSARVQEETGCRDMPQPALRRALRREWRGRCADDRGL